MSPAWLLDFFAPVMLVLAAVSATRLAAVWLPIHQLSSVDPTGSRSAPRDCCGADTGIAHLLMGIAMAGMLEPDVNTLPPQAWEAIFGLLAAWFAWRIADDTRVNTLRSLVSGDRAVQLLHCAAMVYMFAAPRTSDGICTTGLANSVVGALKFPAVALAFAAVLVGFCVKDLLGQLPDRRHSLRLTPSVDAAPSAGARSMMACRIAMGLTMAFMLVVMS
jgi:Domain of unknown function (DUF5134)